MELLERLRTEIRVRHYSIRTEHAYVEWVTRFVRFHNMRHPEEMGAAEIRAFVSHLATDANVSAATQNQALCALVFLYQHVLGHSPGDLQGIVRAKRPRRMPVVLSVDETQRILACMSGRARLMATLMYGTGMRIIEVIRLRVKDVDLANGVILVRDGKGEKDRYVPLPRTLTDELRDQIVRVKRLHDQDLRDGYGTVHLPYALERKYPNTNKAFHWQYLFPSPTLSVDPRSGVRQRHHVYESVLQQAIRDAAAKAGVRKDVHSHTFRHSCATHVLASGSDIRTVQELLGHKDVRTTQIYTHVLHMGPQGLVSPADRLTLPPDPSRRSGGGKAISRPEEDTASVAGQVAPPPVGAAPIERVSPAPQGTPPPPTSNRPTGAPHEPASALPPAQHRVGIMRFASPPTEHGAAGRLRRVAEAILAWAALVVRTWSTWRGGHPCGT